SRLPMYPYLPYTTLCRSLAGARRLRYGLTVPSILRTAAGRERPRRGRVQRGLGARGSSRGRRRGGLLGRSLLGSRLFRGGLLGRSEEHTSELQSRENLVC